MDLVPVLLSWIRLSLPPPLGRIWGRDMFGRLELSRIGRGELNLALVGQPPHSVLVGVANWILRADRDGQRLEARRNEHR
jgi:hypothetical protein